MTYVIVAILGVFFTFLGFVTECVVGNIAHVENGREPNAGAALFPSIPLIPAFFVGAAWGLEQLHVGLGLWTIAGLVALYVPFWWRGLGRLNKELELKIAAREGEFLTIEKGDATDRPSADPRSQR